MSIIEAMQVWRYDLPYGTGGQQEYIDAAIKIDHTLAEYLALKPDWTQAPEEVQWYTIDADGFACWNMDEPLMGSSMWSSVRRMYAGWSIPIPIGIDWRLCKWQRPVTAQ